MRILYEIWLIRSPEWTDSIYNTLQQITEFWFRSFTATPALARLRAGYFLKELLENFTNKTLGTLSPDRTFFMYSAHDVTLVNILNSLKLYDVSMIFIFWNRENNLLSPQIDGTAAICIDCSIRVTSIQWAILCPNFLQKESNEMRSTAVHSKLRNEMPIGTVSQSLSKYYPRARLWYRVPSSKWELNWPDGLNFIYCYLHFYRKVQTNAFICSHKLEFLRCILLEIKKNVTWREEIDLFLDWKPDICTDFSIKK